MERSCGKENEEEKEENEGTDEEGEGRQAEREQNRGSITILVVNLSVVIQEGGTVGDKFHREHRPPLLRNQFETCTPAAPFLPSLPPPRSPPRWLGSLLPPSPLYPPFDWRDKSLRLTGSRRITGTGDIYARLAHRPGHYP